MTPNSYHVLTDVHQNVVLLAQPSDGLRLQPKASHQTFKMQLREFRQSEGQTSLNV